MKSIRIGSGAGYGGDRIEPAMELIEKGALDYIIFECLAERTIALGQEEKKRDSSKGYNPLLDYRMRRILPLLREHKVKVITNMGAANVEAAVQITFELAEEFGLDGLKIAGVTGDDVTTQIKASGHLDVLETQDKLNNLEGNLISANAYMGAEGIVQALSEGADIVITGRVADPSLVIGPLVHEFGWQADQHPNQMGQGVLAGHLLECAGQVTGGYYADPGYKEVPNLHRIGFPYVDMTEDGTFTISKVAGSGGLVSVDTCKEQMIYEIHDPARYMTPDAIADFSKVLFTQVGTDKVLAEHATSHGKPDTLKVSVGYEDGYIGEGEISYGGQNCLARAKLAAQIIEKRIVDTGIDTDEYRCDYIGYDSLYQSKITALLTEAQPCEVRLRISGRTKDETNAWLLANEVEALYTNGPAGGSGARKRIEKVVSVCSVFIPREKVKSQVECLISHRKEGYEE